MGMHEANNIALTHLALNCYTLFRPAYPGIVHVLAQVLIRFLFVNVSALNALLKEPKLQLLLSVITAFGKCIENKICFQTRWLGNLFLITYGIRALRNLMFT